MHWRLSVNAREGGDSQTERNTASRESWSPPEFQKIKSFSDSTRRMSGRTLNMLRLSANDSKLWRRFDWFVEKHEGPWLWEGFLKHCEIIRIKGHDTLLPVFVDHHQNVKVIRCLESRDGKSLTLFLKDTTYVADPEREWAEAGLMAVCEKFEGEDFFIATLYHQCYLVDEMPKRRKTNQR